MILEHPELDSFEGLLGRITDTAFTGGLQALSRAGRTVHDTEGDRSAYRRFIRGCHYGFDLAQSHIVSAVIHLRVELAHQVLRREDRRAEARGEMIARIGVSDQFAMARVQVHAAGARSRWRESSA